MSAKKRSFEEGMAELEALVRSIEDGELGLEETVAAYEKGVKLVKALEKQLGQSRGKLESLLENEERQEMGETDAQL